MYIIYVVQCPVLLVIGYWLCYDAKANKVFFMTKFIFTLRSFGCINASKFNFDLNSITLYFMLHGDTVLKYNIRISFASLVIGWNHVLLYRSTCHICHYIILQG